MLLWLCDAHRFPVLGGHIQAAIWLMPPDTDDKFLREILWQNCSGAVPGEKLPALLANIHGNVL
jgi:hypothetical protein